MFEGKKEKQRKRVQMWREDEWCTPWERCGSAYITRTTEHGHVRYKPRIASPSYGGEGREQEKGVYTTHGIYFGSRKLPTKLLHVGKSHGKSSLQPIKKEQRLRVSPTADGHNSRGAVGHLVGDEGSTKRESRC